MGSAHGEHFDPDRFWKRFAAEAHELANALSARERGEAIHDDPVGRLNSLLALYDLNLAADLSMSEKDCRVMRLSGRNQASIAGLLTSAPNIHGWKFTSTIPSSITEPPPPS